MKVAALETIPVSVPYTHREVSSQVARDGVSDVLVKLTTDDGLVGWGEACCGADTASSTLRFARWRRSSSVRIPGTEKQCTATRSRTASGSSAPAPATSRGPASTWRSGISADARATCRSGACSAGCRSRSRRTSTTSHAGREKHSQTGRRRPQARLRRLLPQGRAPDEEDLAMVAATREALGAEPLLRVDANGSWTLPQAVRMLRALEEFEIDFVEQPVRDHPIELLAELRNRTGITICANEGLWSTLRRTRASGLGRRTCSASRSTGSGRSSAFNGWRGSPSARAYRSASTLTASSVSPPQLRTTWC